MNPDRPLSANRPFLAYLVSAGLADTGFFFYSVANGWLVLKLTNSPLWLGLIAGSAQAPFLIFTLLGGSLADRFDRRALVAVGNGGLALMALTLALVVAANAISLALLALLAFGIGSVIALEHPVDRAWLYDLVHGKSLGRAIALSSLEWSVARTLGPALGGVAVASIGIAAGYAVFALSALPIVVLALAIGTRGAATQPASGDARAGSGLRGAIVPFSLLVAAYTAGVLPYVTLLPDIAKNVLHLGANGYGLLSAAGGVGAAAGAVLLARLGDVRHKGRVVPIAMLAGAMLLVALSCERDVATVACTLFALGVVDTFMYSLSNTYVQESASESDRGRANGIFSLAFLGGLPVGNVIVGAAASRLGSETALAFSALAASLACVAFWFGAQTAREGG